MCALLAKVVEALAEAGVNVAVAVALAVAVGLAELRQPARHFDHHACKASGAQSNPAAGMRALICDDRTHLESNILIIQHDGDCHFVWWWLIRSGTCGNRRKSNQGRKVRFLGRSATFYRDFHMVAGTTQRVPRKIILPWECRGATSSPSLSSLLLAVLH
jgi:hypothetical protein